MKTNTCPACGGKMEAVHACPVLLRELLDDPAECVSTGPDTSPEITPTRPTFSGDLDSFRPVRFTGVVT